MPRYVEIDALIEDLQYDIELDARTLDDLDFVDAKGRELVELDKDIKQNAINIFGILRLPPADVRENVHGKWIIDEDGNIECSVCGHHGVGDLYCERCGARMDERDEE